MATNEKKKLDLNRFASITIFLVQKSKTVAWQTELKKKTTTEQQIQLMHNNKRSTFLTDG